MREIIGNLLLLGIWIVLSGVLVRLIYALNESSPIGGGTAVLLWLAGQLVILAPLLRFTWRDRAVGARK